MIEEKKWRQYERDILKNLQSKFPTCKFEFDDSIFGQFSKIDRQVDISFRGEMVGKKILGVVDCKFSENSSIDVKTVESFIGMLEDLNANIGIIITNQSYSTAAKNRASVKNLSLDVVTLSELATIEFDYDDIINIKINNLSLSKAEFFERNQSNSGYFDHHNSSYEKRIIAFKPGFADSEYYAFKKIIKESARIFRDFPQLDKITIQIPTKSTSSEVQGRMYYATVSKYDLEKHLHLDFSELKQDIKKWRADFLENQEYTKASILDFAKEHIKFKKIKNLAK